jgi:ATP-binding cassette subfamily F protein uup
MNLLSVSGLSKMGREAPLFTGVTFGLDEGEKAALIGKNGTGKSTLLACITGRLAPDAGTVVLNKEAGVSFLPQNPEFDPDDTIREHVFSSDSPKLRIIREYEAVCDALAVNADREPGPGLQAKLEALSLTMDSHNLWNYEHQIRSILTTLGIDDLELRMGTLSGGMAKKVALAQVLIEDTRLILLDEPTNHLDIATIAWLEDWLRTTTRSVLMVTHDRYFLDAVCTSIYELDRRVLTLYTGNFSTYLEKKAIAEEIAQNTDARIESVLRTEREWLLRGPQARGTKAKARIDSIHRMINREKFSRDKGFSFEVTGRRLGGKILEIEGVSKSWPAADGGSRTVVRDFSYIFRRGEKIGVFGDNGSGKTTLLNLLTGTIEPDSGSVVRGDNTVFSYYRQNPRFEDRDQTVLEYIREEAELITLADGSTLTAAFLLERFGFEGRVQYSPVATLSGGERKRVYLVRLLMANPNFLVLDEPTNDFDIYTLSVLEQFLTGFGGCLLVVSHDRYFMDRVADTLFVLEDDGSVSGFVGSCSEYIVARAEMAAEKATEAKAAQERAHARENAKRAAANQQGAGSAGLAGSSAGARGASGAADSAGAGLAGAGDPAGANQSGRSSAQKKKRSFKEEKEYGAIESEISALEDRKNDLEHIMSGSTADHEEVRIAAEEYNATVALLEEKYARWEYLASFD